MLRRTGVAPAFNFYFLFIFSWRQAGSLPYEFRPNFLKALALAGVVAKNVHGIFLPQPAVHLRKKFAPLRLGNLRFWRALGQRTESVERIKFWIGGCGLRTGFAGFGFFSKFNRREAALV